MNKKALKDYKSILFMIAIMWLIEIVNSLLSHRLNYFSIYPRQVDHLYGIFSMHFLHWNFSHLMANSLPLLVLSFFASNMGKVKEVTLTIMLLSGILVWSFAREGTHAGASALVMGYWGYLLSSAFFERSFKNILIAILTLLIYGGIVFSLLNFDKNISFEGHIFGFIAGIVSARFWRRKKRSA